MRRALRWIKRIVLGTIAFAIFAAAVVIGFIHTSWGKNFARKQIVAGLQSDFPGSTIGALEGSPFGTIVLRDVMIMGRDGKPMVTVDRIEASAELRPLLSKTVRVESVRVSGVSVHVREQPPEPPKPEPAKPSTPSEPSSWTIEAPSITVFDSKVVVDTVDGPETLDQILIEAGVWLRPGEPLRAAADLRGRWRNRRVGARAVVEQRADDIVLPSAHITVGMAQLDAFDVTITSKPELRGVVVASVPELGAEAMLHAQAGGGIAVRAWDELRHVDVKLVADLKELTARGLLIVTAPEGSAVVALDASIDRAQGIVSTIATVPPLDDGRELPPIAALVAFDASITKADVIAAAASKLGTARAIATVEARDDTWVLAQSHIIGHVHDGYDDIRGRFDVDVSATGTLSPEPSIDVQGTANGAQIAREDLRVAHGRVRFSARGLPASKVITASATAEGIRQGETVVPSASIDAITTIDDVGTIRVALGRHHVRTADYATWTGAGGTVTVTEQAITVAHVRTGSGKSRITADAQLSRINDDMAAKVAVRDVALAIADPTLRGDADADLDVAFKAGRWRGGGTVTARGAQMPGKPAIDATATVKLAGRDVDLTATASNPELGSTTLDVSVTGPRDITDVAAWQRLSRTAIRNVSLKLSDIDARPLGGTGRVDGELALGATDARGSLRVRGVQTEAGPLDADLAVSPGANNTVRTELTATVADFPKATADALLVLPPRPFDPRSWKQLGRRALHAATIRAPEIKVTPALLARFGLESEYTATVSGNVVVATGAASTTLTADVKNITGGTLTAPVNVHVSATTDHTGTRGTINARAAKVAVDVTASSPLTVDAALAGGIPTAKVDAKLTLPSTPARDLLALVGRHDVIDGSVGVTFTVDGTVRSPNLRTQVVAEKLAIRSSLTNKKPPTLDRLDIDARYYVADRRVELDVTGKETGDRILKISARGQPDDLKSVKASIEAANFELTPLAAFAPGNLRGARATLNAALNIRGLDPDSGDVRGMLQLHEVRIPLSPELGTLRRATLDMQVIKQKIVAKLDGRLGAGGGTVNATITAQLQGGMPIEAKLEGKIRKVQPIGAVQPQLDADLTGEWVNHGSLWTGKLVVNQGKVFVPPETGNELLGAGAPADMIFVDGKTNLVVKKGRRPPTKPWLITKVVINRTNVDVDDPVARVVLVARGQLTVSVGDGVGVVGQLITERGTVDVLGRRYRLEQGILDFTGTTDPRLDIRMVHDFRNLTLTVGVRGLASDPDLRLSGDPGTYTEGQLLSFLAGAEPGSDDSNAQANQAVVSGGLTFVSSKVGRRLNKYSPVKFDSINYEAATSSSSRAVRFGKRISDKTYLIWRQRLEARPDENPGEVLLEYQVRPNALFEFTVGERSQGGDFLLRTRW